MSSTVAGAAGPARLHATCPVCEADAPRDAEAIRDYMGSEAFSLARCGTCGARYVEDPPTPERIGSYYATSAGAQMHKPPHRLFALMRDRRIGKDLAPLLAVADPAARIVDLGTGDGSVARYLHRQGRAVGALDVYPAEDWPDRAIPYRQVDLARHGVAPADLDAVSGGHGVDAVVMRHVLEHVHRPYDVLRTLREGGVRHVVVVVPNVESRVARRLGPHWYYWDPPRHLTLFSPATLERLAARAGYAVADRRTYGIDELVTSAHRALVLRGTPRAMRAASVLRPTALVAGGATVLSGPVADAVLHVLLEAPTR